MSDETRFRKYKDVCPDTIHRIYAEELERHKSAKEADKAARKRLHQMTGAFMTLEEYKKAERLLAAFQQGDREALHQTLKLHSSTRERLAEAQTLYECIFEKTGMNGPILDLACGLNPLILGNMGLAVRGIDVSGHCVRLVNAWAHLCGWDVQARCQDLLCAPVLEDAHLALMMKLLPVLEEQKRGSAMELMRFVPAQTIVATFPLRTLSGRNVGMEKHYSAWFEAMLPDTFCILMRFIAADELCYVVSKGYDASGEGGKAHANALCGGDAHRQSE